jgi:hypothetical protein
MPDPTPNPPSPSPAPRPSTALRVGSLVAGSVVGLVAFVLLAVGGVALWANGEKDRDGYLATASDPYATTTYALASEGLDVDLDGLGPVLDADDYGRVRLRVAPHGDKPLFVGIARTSDVSSYLRDSAHATVTDVDTSPFRAEMRTSAGDERPAPPAQRDIWAASAHGAGTQTLDWEVQDGRWSIVVMNEDGSPGVRAGVSAGAELAFLSAVGWGAIGGGAVLLVAAGAFLVAGIRTPRSGAPGAAGLDPAVANAY